jgi:hypothetical protein
VVVDMTITSLKSIFEQLEVFESIFEFLFDAKMLKSLDNDEFKKLVQILILCFLKIICWMMLMQIMIFF